MISLSFTKIEKFLRCPQEYAWYCDRELLKKYHVDTPPLIFGSLMHGVLNDFYKNLDKSERTKEKMIALFLQKYKANKLKHDQIFRNRETVAKYFAMAGKEFTNFLESPLSEIVPYVATEENIKIDLGGVQLWAKIDRMDTSAKGLKIIDYKTGKYIEDEPDPLQLDLYALATFVKFPEIPLHEKSYYYLYDNRFVKVAANSGEFKKTRDHVLQIAEDIAKTKKFEPRKNPKCIWCDFRSICPLWSDQP
jgi:putative RecB family exonuclease